jgi:hypothetical protein
MIFGAGLIGELLLYCSFAAMCIATFRRTVGFTDRLMMLTLLLWLGIIELKEPMLVDLRFVSLLALLLMFNIFTRSRASVPAPHSFGPSVESRTPS